MAAGERISGKCLCEAVTFEATLTDGAMHVCHCSMCRRWTGGMLTYLTVEAGSLDLRSDALSVYRSSEWGERGFCARCGSSLFWRTQDGLVADVSAQAVDDSGRFPFASEIFIDEKPGNYAFANATRKVTGEEFMAKAQESHAGG